MIEFELNYFALSAAVNFLTSVILATIVIIRGHRTPLNVGFFSFAFFAAIWSLGYFFWQISTDAESALFWTRFLMAGAIFAPIGYFHTVIGLLGLWKDKRTWLFGGYIIFVIFLFADLTPLFVNRVEQALSFSFWPKPGLLFHPFLIVWNFYVVYPSYLLIKALRKIGEEDRLLRTQIWYVLVAISIAFISGSTNYLLWYGIPIPPYLNILVSLYVLIIGYAILRHNLFDIKGVATEFLTIGLWIFIIVRLMIPESINQFTADLILLGVALVLGTILIYHIRRMEQMNIHLQKLLNMKREFLDVASHQLRTPVSVILGVMSMFKEGSMDKLTKEQRDNFLDSVYHKAQKLANIINDFLDASEMDTGEPFKLDPKMIRDTDIVDLTRGTIADLSPIAKEKKIELEFDESQKGKVIVGADPERLEQAISNLIDNAIKYTKKGKVSVSVGELNGNAILTVKDTGIGIPDADQAKIFDKFSRGENATDAYTDGSGLGLFIVKGIVEAHEGGRVNFQSSVGKGSTFTISLPLVK